LGFIGYIAAWLLIGFYGHLVWHIKAYEAAWPLVMICLVVGILAYLGSLYLTVDQFRGNQSVWLLVAGALALMGAVMLLRTWLLRLWPRVEFVRVNANV
jgi:hypothetical protein